MTTEQKQYAERNPRELEPYFSRHMLAMTAEDLRGKAEIADELAYRDKQIDTLADRVKELEAQLNQAHSQAAADYCTIQDYEAKVGTVTAQRDELLAGMVKIRDIPDEDCQKYVAKADAIACELIAKIEQEREK